MHKFWLDITKDTEDRLDEQIHTLKLERKFAGTIRDGIRLICDLRQGRVDVLFELFPWVKAEFLAGIHPPKSTSEQAIEAQLKRLEELMTGQGGIPTPVAAVAPANNGTGGPKSMNVADVASPIFADEEDDFELNIKKDTSTNAAQNFINSLTALQGI